MELSSMMFVNFRCNGTGPIALSIACSDHGSLYAESDALTEGYNVTRDNQELNMLTGRKEDGGQ